MMNIIYLPQECLKYSKKRFKNTLNGQIFNQNNGFPPACALFMGGGGTLLHLAQDEAGGNINFRNFRNMQHVPILNTATAVIGH